MKILDFIPVGRENAVTARELTQLLGLKNQRDATKAIERERLAGAPICASNSYGNQGYFLAANAEEFGRFISSLNRRVSNIDKTLQSCRETSKQMQEEK